MLHCPRATGRYRPATPAPRTALAQAAAGLGFGKTSFDGIQGLVLQALGALACVVSGKGFARFAHVQTGFVGDAAQRGPIPNLTRHRVTLRQ